MMINQKIPKISVPVSQEEIAPNDCKIQEFAKNKSAKVDVVSKIIVINKSFSTKKN